MEDEHNQAQNVPAKLLKPYDPAETEGRIYKLWEESGFFNPDVCIQKGVTKNDAESFSIVLPPPNVTGRLHLGHALEHSLQDAVVRFKRMQGYKTLWIPGTDHAAIATQARFEKNLTKETGKSRHDFSRNDFFNMVNEFGLINQKDMQTQMRLFGSSLDWSREAFTLDANRSLAVRTAFKQMYDEGLIYKGHKVINWDPKGQTTVSDDELVYVERDATLYTFKYSANFPISISTTRPETKVGDTAVAVNPNDERYKQYIGQEFDAVFCNVPIHIKIIADYSVEAEFGTGALGVTPAHSQIDAEIAMRHELPSVQVINEYAKIMVGDENLIGKKTSEAREIVAQWLRDNNLMEKEEKIKQNVSTSERTEAIIEPLPKMQWFINVNKQIPSHKNKTLKELMLEAVEKDGVKIIPDRFDKTYRHWINNLRDWCISRQIIYGHQIPVWYKGDELYCGINPPAGEPEGDGWTQDTDTLDTWFSSGLWTFSTLGWPNNTDDFKNYHPTTLINPGYEILPPWVARMILMSKYLLNEVPFKTVYLHGIVRDSKGIKFSKSLKNGIEPEEIIKDCGTDALRMSMVVGIGPGNDTNFDIQKVKAYSKFANKLWNITRFILSSTTQTNTLDLSQKPNLPDTESNILDEFEAILIDITTDIENYRLYIASEKLYHYVWHNFADIIIEESKDILKNGSTDEKNNRSWLLMYILTRSIQALHPFMPFITEELWSFLPKTNKEQDNLLIITPWPITAGKQ
ncbi:valine--tRNA ligase [Candidatus Nomurabacteria bacterium RIFCSPHIGHO2_02_FULL_38_15]|uniref:Valine--tRNA ligase n=1 Tax=Candidatus Nomurabacteria bacterium RIFCSPHIGHO2_02_FULL_38_15 TaxID=1801752 RepID=A0A1F6VSA3_9BACT|nr:MAG: valine--tRNA ligase [Candidatus Nomurabacteria bacterium RIFCSPHIGHO2_02_FULL_38_15]